MNHPDFLILPYEILADDRLTLRHIRVLMAIFSWRKKNTNLARVSRELLADRTGYQVSRISTITTELSSLGWIEKVGNGGKSQWSEYRVKDVSISTENRYQNGNGNQISNGYQNGNETVPNSVTQTVTNSGRGIDTEVNNSSNNSSEKTRAKKASEKFDLLTELMSRGADASGARDFLLVRKEKKATNTQAAFNRFLKQCEKAGCSVAEAVEICAERGWASFQSDWEGFQSELNSLRGISVPQKQTSMPLTGSDIDTAWEDDL